MQILWLVSQEILRVFYLVTEVIAHVEVLARRYIIADIEVDFSHLLNDRLNIVYSHYLMNSKIVERNFFLAHVHWIQNTL